MAMQLDKDRDTLGQDFKNKSRRRRQRQHRSAEAEGARTRTPRRNDLRPRLRMLDVPVAELRGAKRRIHKRDEAHVLAVMASIEGFGISAPILVTGDLEIVDGHTTVEAAGRLGIETLPCVIIDHLTPEEIRLLRLALNRLPQNATWDFETIQIEMQELIDLDSPIELSGFTAPEIDQILLDDGNENEPEDHDLEPDPRAPVVSRPGDRWTLDRHAIVNGNALVGEDYTRLLRGVRIRLVLTDVPFNVKIKGHVTSGDHEEFLMAAGEMSRDEFINFNVVWFSLAMEHTLDGGLIASFIDWRSVETILMVGRELGLNLLNLIVWAKTNGGMGSLYRSQHELLPLFKSGTEPHVNNVELGRHGRWRSNVWTAPGASSLGSDSRDGLKLHPTVKPVALLEDALLDITRRGDAVLDPFLGSGSTLIAAEKTGRRAFGIELDDRYVDVAIRRWQSLTGLDAVLSDTGETFAEVATRRAENREPDLKRLPKPRLRIAAGSSQGDR